MKTFKEILRNQADISNDFYYDEDGYHLYDGGADTIINAMRIACEQILDLAAENAEVDIDYMFDGEDERPVSNGVDKESILKLKEQLK